MLFANENEKKIAAFKLAGTQRGVCRDSSITVRELPEFRATIAGKGGKKDTTYRIAGPEGATTEEATAELTKQLSADALHPVEWTAEPKWVGAKLWVECQLEPTLGKLISFGVLPPLFLLLVGLTFSWVRRGFQK